MSMSKNKILLSFSCRQGFNALRLNTVLYVIIIARFAIPLNSFLSNLFFTKFQSNLFQFQSQSQAKENDALIFFHVGTIVVL
jgi:hypothetical protein